MAYLHRYVRLDKESSYEEGKEIHEFHEVKSTSNIPDILESEGWEYHETIDLNKPIEEEA